MSSAGFKRPGVVCKFCQEPFPLFMGTTDSSQVEKLPDPFVARCPVCVQEATYLKSAIATVMVRG